MTKKTNARIIRVVTKDNPSANDIHALFGITNARGKITPSRTNAAPNGNVT